MFTFPPFWRRCTAPNPFPESHNAPHIIPSEGMISYHILNKQLTDQYKEQNSYVLVLKIKFNQTKMEKVYDVAFRDAS